MHKVGQVTKVYDELSTFTCSDPRYMGRILTLQALKEELGTEAVFICGSHRFGYQIPESDMDITIYYKTIGHEKLSVEHLIYSNIFEFIRSISPEGISKDELLMEDKSVEHRWDTECTGAKVFHIPVFDIHLRVHTDLNTFQNEKAIHDLVKKRVPKRTIDKLKYYRLHDPSDYPIKGANIYKSLKEQYVDKNPNILRRLYWWITSYLHHPREFM